MNICFAKNLFAMQQTESSAGQVDVAGQLSSQMCSQYPEFECLGEDVLDALEGGRENGSFIKTDIVFDSQERSEEHTLNSSHSRASRMPSSA